MLKKDRYHHILSWFEANQPEVQTELRYGSPFQLLVAVILSAQCTDRRVNMVTPELFRRFPEAYRQTYNQCPSRVPRSRTA